jgi:glycosyltransferase involved in cell wall biosynthesis
LVDYIGEIGDNEKNDFLGQAYALLFPIDWPEPFGLVMIESLACGTPVIAYHRGSVPEIIENGVTGWIVKSLDDALAAVQQVSTLSRRYCRQIFEERFLVSRMAKDYVDLYQTLLGKRNVRVAS